MSRIFLISRTDAIGDVVLTLPVAGRLKQLFPGCRVLLLGRTYTQAVAQACPWLDGFVNLDELLPLPENAQIAALQASGADTILHVFPNRQLAWLARRAGIRYRIGTRNRWFHWLTCTKLISLSRRHSPLHEAQLNLQMLHGLGETGSMPLEAVAPLVQLTPTVPLRPELHRLLADRQPGQLNVILHPRSRGSAREWGLAHFGTLAKLLHQAGHRIFITGTAAEGEELHAWLREHQSYLTADLTGQLGLPEFLAFIAAADGLVAGSTGPLHLAAALGRNVLGLYPPIRPMHPGRWAPLGAHASYMVFDKPDCQDCRAQPAGCACIKALEPVQVAHQVCRWVVLPLRTPD